MSDLNYRHRSQAATISASVTPTFALDQAAALCAIYCVSTSSLTMTVSGTVDGTTWVNLPVWKINGLEVPAGVTITAATTDILMVPVAGLTQIRCVRVAGSGTLSFASSLASMSSKDFGTGCQCHFFIPDGTDENLISASARHLVGAYIFTIDATPAYVKLYDKATAPDENDTPLLAIGIPANSTSTLGSGNNHNYPEPIKFTNGLGVRAVTGIANNNDSALTTAENLVAILWK